MLYNEEELRAIVISGSLSLLLLAIFVVALVIIFHRNIRQKQREGFKQVLDAIENERKRIGQNLHDDVGPVLGGIKLSLSAYNPYTSAHPHLKELVESQKKTLSEVITNIRQSSHELSSATLERYGLIQALDERCTLINSSSDWMVTVTGQEYPETASYSSSMNLFRIISELLHNSIKHSEGNRIDVSFVQPTQQTLLILYADNGKGMDIDNQNPGLGLSGIKTRVELLNGQVRLNSFPGNGFKLQISLQTKHLL